MHLTFPTIVSCNDHQAYGIQIERHKSAPSKKQIFFQGRGNLDTIFLGRHMSS